VGGTLADRSRTRRHLLWLFAVIGITQLSFTILSCSAGPPDLSYAPFLATSVLFGAAALFAIGPIQQKRLIGAAPDQEFQQNNSKL
jgi:nitrate/nitrite transporter NarK